MKSTLATPAKSLNAAEPPDRTARAHVKLTKNSLPPSKLSPRETREPTAQNVTGQLSRPAHPF